MVIRRRSLLLAGIALPAVARAQCVTSAPSVDACLGGVRITGVPGATLDLSFMTPGTLDPRITFTRASTAAYFDASGTLQTAAINAPRWDYAPVTHALNGLLIEEARTNILLNSANLGTASWSLLNTSVVSGVAGAPDGTATVSKLNELAGTAAHYTRQSVTLAASTQYTLSLYAKAAEDRYLQVGLDDGGTNGGFATFDLQTGVISGALTALGTGALGGAVIQAIGNGFYRCSITTSIGAGTTGRALLLLSNVAAPGYAPSYAGISGNGLLLWGAQLEAGAFPTSYIPTTAASVTRTADVCSIPTSAWFNAAASSLAVDFMVPNVVQQSRDPCGLTDGTSTNRLALRAISGGTGIATTVTSISSVSTISTSLGLFSQNTVAKQAASWNGTTNLGCLNAAPVVSTAVGMPSGLNVLCVGNFLPASTINCINGWVRRVRYWPRALSAAELQSVTT